MKKAKNLKNTISYHQFILISTCFVFVFVLALSIGYSAYSVALEITGEAVVRADVPLRIIDNSIKSLDNSGTEKASSKYSVDTISNHIELPNCNSTASYNITIKNDNDYPVIIKSLIKESWNNNNIDFEVIGYDLGSQVIKQNSEQNFELKFKNITCESENKLLDSILKFEKDNFKIKFNPNYEGSVINTVQISDSNYKQYFNEITRTGYDFLGWYTDPINGTKITSSNISSISNNQELFAHWDLKAMTITYVDFDDISTYPKTVKYGNTLTINFDQSIERVSVFKNNVLLLKNQEYTFDNNIFTMNNVVSNIVIYNSTLTNYSIIQEGLISYSNQNNSTETKFGDMSIHTGESCQGYPKNCYIGDSLLYDEDQSLKLDSTAPIVDLKLNNVDVSEGYSINITVKAPTDQFVNNLQGTLVAISQANANYLSWVGFNRNYINIFSYYSGQAFGKNVEYAKKGFLSTNILEYDNQLINIQITAEREGLTNLYINGSFIKSFSSGGSNLAYDSITIGDLRPGRNLKFTGNIYDFALYDRKLTDEEVQQNYIASIDNYNNR